MCDITGKKIKAGMCVELDYGNGTGIGLGVIYEKDGILGFFDYPNNEFIPLSEISIGFLKIVKE
jgi:hypothetical protein